MPRKRRQVPPPPKNSTAVFWDRRRSVVKLREGIAKLQPIKEELEAMLAAVNEEIAANEALIRYHLSFDQAGRLFPEEGHAPPPPHSGTS